jgi:sugar lactone lactonase YvrE
MTSGGKAMLSRSCWLIVLLCPFPAAAQLSPVAATTPGLRFDTKVRFQQSGRIHGLAFAPDGKTLAVADSRGKFGLWSPITGKVLRPHRELPAGLGAVAFSPDGKTLALGSADGVVYLWETATDSERGVLKGHGEEIRALAFSPDGRLLASGSTDQTARLWDMVGGKQLHLLNEHRSWVQSVAFAPDGKSLLTGSRDQTARLWDTVSGKEGRTFRTLDNQVWAVAFAPDGRSVAVGGGDNIVRLWNPQTGKEVRSLPGHSARVWALAYSADGRILASGSEDKTILLWEAISGRLIGTLMQSDACITSATFSPASRVLAAGSEKGQVYLWDLTFSGKAGEPLSGPELDAIWASLGGDDVGRVFADMARMSTAPKESVVFLRERLRPVPVLEAEQMSRLIADLDSERFPVRQKSAHELELQAEAAESALRKALDAKPSLEMSKRLQDLLRPLETQMPPGSRLRVLRAIQVLEDAGTTEAQQVLETLSKGAVGAQVTLEAKAALLRLTRR